MKEADILWYATPDGAIKVEIRFEDETFWLTQKKLSELFGVEVPTINYHLKEIFKSGELEEDSVIRKIRITAQDGKKYLTNFYNLDAIIAVGYRVNSYQATQFRIWATKVLREYLNIPRHQALRLRVASFDLRVACSSMASSNAHGRGQYQQS